MIKTLYLLRHCVTADSEKGINGGQTDTPLSENGLKAATDLIPILSKNIYDLVYTSPLQRTRQTIEPYLNSLGVKPLVVVEPLTIERSLGILTNSISGDGQVPASIKASGKSKVDWRPEEGESTFDVSVRASKFLEILKTRDESNILICAHQNFLRCLELQIQNIPISDETFFSDSPPKLEPGEIRVYGIEN